MINTCNDSTLPCLSLPLIDLLITPIITAWFATTDLNGLIAVSYAHRRGITPFFCHDRYMLTKTAWNC